MSPSRWASAAAGVAVITLAISFLSSRAPALGILPVLLGLLWIVAAGQRWDWIASPMWTGCIGLASLATFLGAHPIGPPVGALAALVAWDLDGLHGRLRSATRIHGESRIVERHIWRLTGVLGLSLALSIVALVTRVRLDLGWAIGLGLLAAWGLSRAVRFMRRESG
jgi:hypothetical protein